MSLFPEPTRLASRYVIVLLCAVVAVAGLAACGSSGGGVSSVRTTAASAPTATTTTPATTTGATPAPAAKTAPKAPSSPPSSSFAAGGAGGGAASFREPHGDNSIPDFGGEASAGEQARAARTLAAFLDARAGGEWAKACPYLARATRAQVERFAGAAKGNAVGCGAALRALSGGGGGGRSELSGETLAGAPAALRVEGKSAFALYYGQDKSKYVMPMVKEGDAWKIGQLAPLSYPLGASGGVP